MANWTYGGVRIFVTDLETVNNQIIARLFPYESDTVHQVFGQEGAASTLTCKVVGNLDPALLQSFTTSGTSFELVSPNGSLGNFILRSANFKVDPSVRQTLRTDLPLNSWVYTTKLELYKD